MAYEDRPRSAIADKQDLLVYIPEAAEPGEERVVVVDRPIPRRTSWFERKEAPWVIVGIAGILIAILLLLPQQTQTVSASPEGDGGVSSVDTDVPVWAALALPVPESYRTHTANVAGSVDVLAVADFGPGAADPYVGSVTTADGPTVGQVFSDQTFTIASPTGATVVAFMPYGSAVIPQPGEAVTFVGTLMPVPDDFAGWAGSEAAFIGGSTDVYVTVVPETLSIVVPVSETI